MGFKAAAKNVLLGKKVELKSFQKEDGGSYHLTPRKLSVDARTALRKAQVELGAAASPEVQKMLKEKAVEYRKAHKIKEEKEVSMADLQQLMSDVEWQKMLDATKGAFDQVNIIKIYLLHGIGVHDLDDTEGKVLPIDEALVDSIMDIEVLATEMVDIIREWDSPLQEGSGNN